MATDSTLTSPGTTRFIGAARALLDRLEEQADAIEQVAASARTRSRPAGSSTSSAPATRASRSRRCSRATARIPGFNPIVELSMTFHTQVVGANGQRQAMFIERVAGPRRDDPRQLRAAPDRRDDRLQRERAVGRPDRDGASAPAARGLTVVAVTSVAQSLRRRPPGTRPARACSTTPTSCSTCARRAGDALVDDRRARDAGRRRARRSPPSRSSTRSRRRRPRCSSSAARMPPVLTSAAVVGAERPRRLFDAAYAEHARRVRPVTARRSMRPLPWKKGEMSA